jgi:hypothetical protein
MLNNDTPLGAPIGVPTHKDTNAASRAGDAAPVTKGLAKNPEDQPKTLSSDAEGSSDHQSQAVHDEAIGWLVEADQ